MSEKELPLDRLIYLLTEAEENKKSAELQIRILKDEVMRRFKTGELIELKGEIEQ